MESKFAEYYSITSAGNVISTNPNNPRRGQPYRIKPFLFKQSGYLQVLLPIDGKPKYFYVHRLVAQAFIPNPENKPFVNHLNGIKTDNRVENLEWTTPAENAQHSVKIGLTPQGGASPTAKLTDEQAAWVRNVYVPRDINFGAKALANKFNVSSGVIKRIVHGTGYKTAGGVFHRKFRVPDDVRAEICQLYNRGIAGCGVRSLARQFGLSKTTIQRIPKESRRALLLSHGQD